MASDSATKFKDAYFTSPADAAWCIDRLGEQYELKDKIALEPAAGSGVFLRASKKTGLNWVTNELYPEFAQGYEADFSVDFAKDDLSDLGTFDFIITNPPFGTSSSLARKFVKRSLDISNVVAMLLPRGCRRRTFLDRDIPDDVKITIDEDLPGGVFDLPDGTTRKVGCVFMAFERVPGYSRGKLLDYKPVGYKGERRLFKKGDPVEGFWPDWATHGVCLWGSAGKTFDKTRTKPYAEVVFLKLTKKQFKVVEGIDWDPLINQTRTTVPRLLPPEVFTEINRALRAS